MPESIDLLLITADAPLARAAMEAGIDWVFIDLEIKGKHARQGHRDTVISGHTIDDIVRVRQVIPTHNLLVRIDPWNEESSTQVESVLQAGAGAIMLPMFVHADEVRRFTEAVAGRARTFGLVETPGALENMDEILESGGLDQIHFGINDLSLALGRDFLFEVMADGSLNQAVDKCRSYGMRFGIGGVGRIGTGDLSADLILAEHERLGSQAVILSRSFTDGKKQLADLSPNFNLMDEVARLRDRLSELGRRASDQRERDRLQFIAQTQAVAERIRRSRS